MTGATSPRRLVPAALAAAALMLFGMAGASAEDDATAALRSWVEDGARPVLLAQSSPEGGLIIIPTDPPPEEPAAAPVPEGDVDEAVEFDKPLVLAPVPLKDHSIAELIQGEPMFPPIEGLDPKFWKKHCDNCHQWNKERLCEQAKTYVGIGEHTIFRLAHPLGAPFKVALMRWAKGGCL